MKHFISLVLMAMLLSSCGDRFSAVEEGMTTTQLKEIVGEPDSIRNDFFSDVWFYDTHIISVEGDKVTLVRSKADIQKEMLKMQKEIENLR